MSIDDINLLQKAGINPYQYTDLTSYERMYYFGLLSGQLKDRDLKTLNYKDFYQYIQKQQYIPLTEVEKRVLQYSQQQTYHYIKSLGDKIVSETEQELNSIDKKRYTEKEFLKKQISESIQKRESNKELMSFLGQRMKKWEVDLGRIVETEMHNVWEWGRILQIEKETSSSQLVYKQVYPGACKICISLYTSSGIGSEPKLFTINELKKNGDNIGKKNAEMKPVIGATHPFCRCTLFEYDDNYLWNKKTFAFDIMKPYERKVERKSKIKIQVGDKFFEA